MYDPSTHSRCARSQVGGRVFIKDTHVGMTGVLVQIVNKGSKSIKSLIQRDKGQGKGQGKGKGEGKGKGKGEDEDEDEDEDKDEVKVKDKDKDKDKDKESLAKRVLRITDLLSFLCN